MHFNFLFVPQAIIFDLRDTLLAVKAAYVQANERLFGELKKLGAPLDELEYQSIIKPIPEQLAKIHGRDEHFHDSTTAFVHLVLEAAKFPVPAETLQNLVAAHDSTFAQAVTLYSDADIVLPRLKAAGCKRGQVVDGTRRRERQIMKHLNLAEVFNAIIISEEVGENKLTIKPLWTALEQLGVAPPRAVVVGDREDHDIIPAKKLGCRAVKLVRPHPRFDKAAEPTMADAVVESLLELEKLIRHWTYAQVRVNSK